MKKTPLIISLVVVLAVVTLIVVVHAQDTPTTPAPTTNLFESMPNATVHQDSLLQQMMEDHWQGRVRGEKEMQGWRVQIYSSNNQLVAKQEAEALKQQFESELKEPVYVDFIQPFWKVRIGDFQTQKEAKDFRDKLVELYPELQAESYPVRDLITVRQ